MPSADELQGAQLRSLNFVSGLTDMLRMWGIGLRKCSSHIPAVQTKTITSLSSDAQGRARQMNAICGDVVPPKSVRAKVAYRRIAPEVLAGSILIAPFIFCLALGEYLHRLNADVDYSQEYRRLVMHFHCIHRYPERS